MATSEYEAMLAGIEYGAERSWEYALDAVIDAISALTYGTGIGWIAGEWINRNEVLAAIDALREKP